LINELRALDNAGDDRYFLHIFNGQRWSLQKGRVWKVCDGRTLHTVTGSPDEEFLDDSGTLSDVPDLDLVLADKVVPPRPAEAAAEVATPSVPAEVVRVPALGEEDAALPGEDPQVG
jgi:hypothetical protein